MTGKAESIVRELLDRHGRLYAEVRHPARRPSGSPLPAARAGHAAERADPGRYRGRGRPGAVRAGYRTPKAMSEASWQDRVDALGRGHYRRYDERTATMLGDGADLLSSKWHGDLRKLRDESGGDVRGIASRLTHVSWSGTRWREYLPA